MRSLILILLALNPLSFNFWYTLIDSPFSGDVALFPDELYSYMSNVPEEQEEPLTLFLKAWEEDSLFTEDQKAEIVNMSQVMIQRKVRPTPHFVAFLECIVTMHNGYLSEDDLKTWKEGYLELINNRKTKTSEILSILTNSNIFFKEQNLYVSSATSWKYVGGNYIIRVEKDQPMYCELQNTELRCYAKRDSISVKETSGRYYLIDNEWKGTLGKVTWEHAGFEPDKVFANLGEFDISLKKSEFFAEDVSFTNVYYFDEPLKGSLHHKVMLIKDPETATYPQFASYTKTFQLEDLYPDINYSGGLAMHGAKLVGQGSVDKPATLYMYRLDTLRLVARSLYYGFRAGQISSQSTEISIRLKNDSIYHPDLIFNYRVANRELILLKSENFSSQSPYYNSYHAVDMNFDQLRWLMDENYLTFEAAKGSVTGNAFFQSVNFFNYDQFLDLQMMDAEHPLLNLRRFSRAIGKEEFPVQAYADYLYMPLATVKQQAMRLAYYGFIFYDYNTETIRLKPRLHDYIAASANRIDYDVISFPSRVEAPLENATFDLRTYDLTINGIPQVHLSDSQNVSIFPEGNRIILKSNRNFQFNGRVDAGLLSFKGKNFFFNYDSFKINLQNIDSIRIRYQTGKRDNYGLPITATVTNLIEHVTGEILIDRNDNKSGKESLPQYPLFVSREDSYVYYNRRNIEGGVYSAEDFFVKLDPFIMDSLDNFNYKGLVYEGEFESAGIFPTFRKLLSIQPDRSLGFEHTAPPSGFTAYGGKGTYYDKLSLSNKGLRGDGKLQYLTSTTWSQDIIFHPDSMMTLANVYEIAEKTVETEYPKAKSKNDQILWHPYADVMYAKNTDSLFTMFNDTTTLNGKLELRPAGLTGSGLMDLSNCDIRSDLFSYKAKDIFTDTSDFNLKSLHSDEYTVLTTNVNTHINYRERKGYFKSNDEFTLVDFPENRYVSYLDVFIWDMKNKELALGTAPEPEQTTGNEDVEPYGPRYISVHPKQDSLNFVSPLAYYDYDKNRIKAEYVKFIDVADARIYPKDGKVVVNIDADMQKLENTRVKANVLTQFHNIHTASVKVTSRSNYFGKGDYDYVDENNDIQLIHFHDIGVDTGGQTYAKGTIEVTDEFTLSPVFAYQGAVELQANRPLLAFKGATQIEHNCERIPSDWVRFESEIDPQDIYIPLTSQLRNWDRANIFSNLFLFYDSVHIYPAFFTNRKFHSDQPILSAGEYLYYSKAQKMYKIGSKEKINDFSLPEPYMNLQREDCMLYGEGPINLGENLGQVKLKTFGSVNHNLNTHQTAFKIMMGIDFFIEQEYINYVGNEIDSMPKLAATDLKDQLLVKSMKAMAGTTEYQAMMDELTLFGTVKEMPAGLVRTLLLNEVNLVWNDESNSYQSTGPIGIASINGIQINKQVEGFIELQIKRSGDIFDIYLQPDPRTFFYFGYTRGVMQVLTGDQAQMQRIMDMKPRDRKMTVPRGETSYIYLVSTNRKATSFKRRWQNILEGNNDAPPDDDDF